MDATPLTLNMLTPPPVPLITGVDSKTDIITIINYLNSLIDYFYNVNISISTDALILTPEVRIESIPVLFQPFTTVGWADGVSTTGFIFWRVPESYISGNLTVTLTRRGAATNTAIMSWVAYRFRDNTAFSVAVGTTSINFTPLDTNTHNVTLTIPAAAFTNGDWIRIDITRDGLNGSDNMTTEVAYDGSSISYSAYKGIP